MTGLLSQGVPKQLKIPFILSNTTILINLKIYLKQKKTLEQLNLKFQEIFTNKQFLIKTKNLSKKYNKILILMSAVLVSST